MWRIIHLSGKWHFPRWVDIGFTPEHNYFRCAHCGRECKTGR